MIHSDEHVLEVTWADDGHQVLHLSETDHMVYSFISGPVPLPQCICSSVLNSRRSRCSRCLWLYCLPSLLLSLTLFFSSGVNVSIPLMLDAVNGSTVPATLLIVRARPSTSHITSSASRPTSSSRPRSSGSDLHQPMRVTTFPSASPKATRRVTSTPASWTASQVPSTCTENSTGPKTSWSRWRWSSWDRGRTPPSSLGSMSLLHPALCNTMKKREMDSDFHVVLNLLMCRFIFITPRNIQTLLKNIINCILMCVPELRNRWTSCRL